MSFDNVILAYIKFTQHIKQVDGHKQMKWMKEHGAMIKEGRHFICNWAIIGFQVDEIQY